MRRSRHRQGSEENTAPRGSYRSKSQEWDELIENSRESLNIARMIFQRQDAIMRGLQMVNTNVNTAEDNAVSRYTDMLANVTKLTDRAAGLEAVMKALADTPNDAEWKELNDKIIATSDVVQAAIDYGTPAVVPTEPPPIVEPPLPSGGGAKLNE